jgi:hypothetical protein
MNGLVEEKSVRLEDDELQAVTWRTPAPVVSGAVRRHDFNLKAQLDFRRLLQNSPEKVKLGSIFDLKKYILILR